MGRTILIVDDSDQEASTLEIALGAIPEAEVWRASDGVEALALLRGAGAGAIRAIVTDLNMPRMDGFDFIQEVRSETRTPRVPILVISGDTNPETPARVYRLGADGYVPKPYSPAEVRKKLEQLLDAYAT